MLYSSCTHGNCERQRVKMLDFRCVRKITSGHAVFNAEVEKEIECRSHEDEPVRFYCDECDTCVCVLCTFHAHRGHRVLSFHDAAARQRSTVHGLMDRCRRRVDQVDQLIGTLGQCDNQVTETEQVIHDTASAFIQVRQNILRYINGFLLRDVKVSRPV